MSMVRTIVRSASAAKCAALVTLVCFQGNAQAAAPVAPIPADQVGATTPDQPPPAEAAPAPQSATLLPEVAEAKQPAKSADKPQVAIPAPQGLQLLIPLKVSGDTKGDAEFKIGAGVGKSLNDRWDLSILGSLRINTSKGFATLFKFADDEVKASPAWAGGLTFSFANVKREPDFEYDNARLGSEFTKGEAYKACNERCPSSDSGDAKDFCDASARHLKRARDRWVTKTAPMLAEDFICDSKKEALGKAITARDQAKTKCAADLVCLRDVGLRFDASRKPLLLSCAEECKPGPDRSLDDAFCGVAGMPMEARPTDFDPEEFCPAGRDAWQKLEEKTRATLRIVPASIDIGGRLGSQQFDFRNEQDGLLKEDDATKVSGAVGFSAYNVFGAQSQLKPFVEGIVLYESAWSAATDTAKWCKPAGMVARSDEDGAPTDTAETCSTAVLGTPTNKRTIMAAAYLGLFENYRSSIRVAVGPELTVPTMKETKRDFDIGIGVPIAFNFGTIAKGLEYKGIAALTPRVKWTFKDGDGSFSAFVELALLGQRGLFSEEFDEL